MVKPYISVEPRGRINLSGFEGDKVKEKVAITSFGEQPLKITDITCNIEDKIKYKLKTKKEGKEYTLEIKNRSKKVGRFSGKIVLKTDHPKRSEIMFYVSGRLKEAVNISPKTISFGTIDTTREDFSTKKFVRNIVLRDIRGNGLTIKKIKTSSDWILTETRNEKKGKESTIFIALDKNKLPKGHFEEKIKVRTNYKRKFQVVNVEGDVI